MSNEKTLVTQITTYFLMFLNSEKLEYDKWKLHTHRDQVLSIDYKQ